MMIFKKAIPRRMFLRGLGASVALPLLDAMTPALASALAGPLEGQATPLRLSYIYVPNGRIMDKWTPVTEGTGFAMTPTLAPLEPFRDKMLVISGLTNREAEVRPGEPMGNHSLANAAFLTGIRGKKGQLAATADQVAARELGKHTQLASLELSLDSPGLVGGADNAFSDAYLNTISWRSETTPLPMENDPRAAFERLFGDGDTTSAAARAARVKADRSLLDFVSQDLSRMMGKVSPADRVKLNEYLEGVRDVERRIQKAEEQSARELPTVNRPTGIPATYDDHARLMFDLQVLALQSDMTRVISFVMGREKTERAFRELGIGEGHHALSHHQGEPSMIAKVAQINLFQSQLFAYYLAKLRATREGTGTLLDNSLIFFASGLSDGNLHRSNNLPVLLLGGGGGKIKAGRHLRFASDTPLTNLHRTILEIGGIDTESLGDSNGKLDIS